MKSNFLTEETNNFGDDVKLEIDDVSECETQNIRLSDGGEVVGNVSSKRVSKKLPRVKQSNIVKSRRGRKITNPLKCRSCGKVFNDTSNRRKHENNRVCSAGKAKHDLIKCIGLHFENVYALLVDVYADIAKHMENVLGKAIFEENKIYLLDESLRLMKRSWISEHFNILASLEVIEKGKSTQMNEANTNNL